MVATIMAHPPYSSKQIKDFLSMFAEIGNVSKCCEALNLCRNDLYLKRRKNKNFAKKWQIAKDASIARLEDEAWRRAFEGVKKPIFYKGEQIKNADGTPYFERTYSDTLLMHRLNAERPNKYQYKHSVDANLSGKFTFKWEDEPDDKTD